MAIEPLMMGSVLASSAIAPPAIAAFSKLNGGVIFFTSIGLSIALSEIVFRIACPAFHYGPLYGLSVVMYLCISAIVAGVTTLVATKIRSVRTERLDRNPS